MLGVLVALTFAIRIFDQAGGQLSLAIVIVFSIFIACLRCLWRPQVGLVSRVLPIASFMAFMFFVFGCLRFDEMSGNMMPRRVSFRWQPAPDERLAKLETAAEPVGIDLTQSTPDDFPQFLGPERTGKVNVEIAGNWNEQPPELVWKKEVGAGHSGFAAVNGYAITMEQRGNDEIVSCYDITTGDVVWSQVNPTRHETIPGGVGPRSTPTVHEGLVYTMGATGILQCLDGSNGEPIWQANLLEFIETTPEAEYNTIQWGRAASPLIDQGRLIVPLGLKADPETDEPGATLICFDAKTGQEIWRSGDYQISYASPAVTTLGGLRQIVQVCESHACGFNADTGEHLWEYPWPGDSAR